MRLKYTGTRPGIVHGEPTWQPGDERDVADDAGRLGSPLWERGHDPEPTPAADEAPVVDDEPEQEPEPTHTTKARTRRVMEDR